MSTDAVKEYLEHPMTQTTVDKIVADMIPIIRNHFDEEDVSPWEVATALVCCCLLLPIPQTLIER